MAERRIALGGLALGFCLGLAMTSFASAVALAEINTSSSPIVLAQATGDEVYTLEERQSAQLGLNVLNLDAGIADGVFGPGTRTAIRRFQQATGQPTTGFLTRNQFFQLQQAMLQARAQGQTAAAPPLTKVELLELQRDLSRLGFYSGAIDGVAGDRTTAAINSFLQSQGRQLSDTSPADYLALVRQSANANPVTANTSGSQPSFDCSRATTATEFAICNSAALASLDVGLQQAYDLALARAAQDQRAAIRADQQSWLKLRNGCGNDAGCLSGAMSARIAALSSGQVNKLFAGQSEAVAEPVKTQAVSNFPAQANAAPTATGAALAGELGIPQKNGYLVAKHPQQPYGTSTDPSFVVPDAPPTDANAWARLESLLYLGLDPERYKEGDRFVRLAALHLTGPDFASFFPDAFQLQKALNYDSLEQAAQFGVYPFGDEFAFVDKKAEFFSRYFPAILASVPKDPIPMLHVVSMKVGNYDTSRNAFPLTDQNLLRNQRGLHVAAFPGNSVDVLTQIASSDLIEQIPQWLEMTPDAARSFRSDMGTEAVVYFAWYSLLDFGPDVIAPRTLVGDGVLPDTVRRGRAEIRYAGIYRDPTLSQQLVEIPAASLAKQTTVTPPESAIVGDTVDISRVSIATDSLLLRHFMETQPVGSEAALVSNSAKVRRATEFTRPDIIAQLVSEFSEIPLGDIWLGGSIEVGEYNLAGGSFDLSDKLSSLGVIAGNEYGVEVKVQLTRPISFGLLQVPQAQAQYIVEARRRQVDLALLVDVDRFVREAGGTIYAYVTPKALAYYYDTYGTYDGSGREAVKRQLVAFERIDSGAQASDAPENFSGQEVRFTTATAGLIYAQKLVQPQRDAFLDGLMPIVWSLEREGLGLPGKAFFPPVSPRPTASVREAFRQDFLAWAQAKAGALDGARYVISANRAYSFGVKNGSYGFAGCRTGQGNLWETSAAGSELGQRLNLQAVAIDQRQAENLAQGGVLQREVLRFTGNLGDDARMCEASDWSIFAEIKRAAFFPVPSGSTDFVATLNDVTLASGRTAFQDAIFHFDAVETRFFEQPLSDARANPVKVIPAGGPSAAEAVAVVKAAEAKAAEDADVFKLQKRAWSGNASCEAGRLSVVFNFDFKVLSKDRLSVTAGFQVAEPYPEVGSFYAEGPMVFDKAIQVTSFDLNDGRWVYNPSGRTLPNLKGRFVSDGAALDLADGSGQCFGFNLAPGKNNGVLNTLAAAASSPEQEASIAKLSDQDVVGIKTGMTMAQAQDIVLDAFKVAVVYETEAPVPGELSALSYMRIFVVDQGTQTITLMSTGRGGPVVAVNRQVLEEQGSIDYETLSKRFAEKYGAPTDASADGTTLVWAGAPSCGPLPLQMIPGRRFMPIQGVNSGGLMPGQQALQLAVTDIGALLEGSARQIIRRPDCETVVQYDTKSYVDRFNASVFHVFMVDIGLLREIEGVTDLAPLEAEGEATTDSEIKL